MKNSVTQIDVSLNAIPPSQIINLNIGTQEKNSCGLNTLRFRRNGALLSRGLENEIREGLE